MDLGVQIEPQFGFRYAEIVAIAQEAERAGFHTIWLSDHLFLNERSERTDCLEAWTVLAALARDTRTIRIGPMVTAQSYRNPALLAKMAAGVDQMSGGRLEFGIGAGWKELEYRAYGYEFPPPGTRVDQLVDALEICTRLWTEERSTYHGKHYRIDAAVSSPKPAQSPLPVWIGGSKPRIMRVAARFAHWFNMTILPVTLEERVRQMDEGLAAACRSVGRDPKTLRRSAFVQAFVASDRPAVDALVGETAKKAGVTPAEWRAARPGAIVGTPDEAAERFRALAKAGVEHANVMFPYGRETEMVRALAEVARAL
ncbi:MAG TPA: TIGR03560 family F420-dependent LLM class oxidoreductase [Candidatus Limnocylindria bacterium]|nr:TIGR03560 family F420-dependent LLM class oxidoreductase [Candidatus Limnocylindria bacterium]